MILEVPFDTGLALPFYSSPDAEENISIYKMEKYDKLIQHLTKVINIYEEHEILDELAESYSEFGNIRLIGKPPSVMIHGCY